MTILRWYSCVVGLLIPGPLFAQTPSPPAAREDPGADLARLIHKAIAAKLPKVYENDSGWGGTVPLPERVRARRVKRTVVEVGDHLEVPDGTWRKVRLSVPDPDSDLTVRVRSFKRLEGEGKYRLTVEADAALKGEADVRRWRYGVMLADLTARADAVLTVLIECDVAVKVPLRLEPEVTDLKLTLKEFTPKGVTFHRAGVTVEGEGVEEAGKEFKGALQEQLRAMEPDLKKRANEAIVRGLKEDKGLFTPAELLKAVTPLLKEEQRSREK